MFDINAFPPTAQHFFTQNSDSWPEAVLAAVAGGVVDTNKLTDLAFYMHHHDLMDGSRGRPLRPAMSDFDALAAHWGQLFDQVQTLVAENADDQPVAPVSDWDVPANVQASVKSFGGQAALDWVLEPPTKPRMAKEFRPASRIRDEMEAILIWKSANPNGTCLAANPARRGKRVQLLKLWRVDLDYWRDQTSTEQHAKVRHTANKVSAREYRRLVLNQKICPARAVEMQREDQRELVWDMFVASFSFVSPFPVPGGALVNSLAQMLGKIAGALEEARDE